MSLLQEYILKSLKEIVETNEITPDELYLNPKTIKVLINEMMRNWFPPDMKKDLRIYGVKIIEDANLETNELIFKAINTPWEPRQWNWGFKTNSGCE